MGDDNIYSMEIVSDTDSTDTTVNSGHTDDDESLLEPRQPLLAEVIRNAGLEINAEGDEQHGAVGGEIRVNERDENNGDNEDDDDDATQVLLVEEINYENEPEPEAEPAADPELEKKDLLKSINHDMSGEEEGQICTICFEPWTSSSEHRLVSLRCGHLFGRSCISKWLRGQGSRCPQCNARARKSEIRPIYARCLKVLDTSERDRALKELEHESELRKKAEMECVEMRLKYQMVVNERDTLLKELSRIKGIMYDTRPKSAYSENPVKAGTVPQPKFSLMSVLELSGGCRILDCNDTLDLMVVSQLSSNQIFKGYGLRKVSLSEMRLCEYVHLHHRPIKDVSFHNHNGLVLTASFDKTLKLTNCLNNSMVQMYNLDCEAWSCAWDLDDPCYFYAGVRTGHVYIFDIRVTDRYVDQLEGPGEASPVIAIQYVKRDPAQAPRKCGPVISHLSSCYYYEKLSPSSFDRHQLPLEGKFTSLSYEVSTSHLLASFRPSIKHPRVTHMLCSLSYEDRNSFQCNFVQSMVGGGSQAQLSRSKLTQHPNNESSVLVCAGDEETKSAMIWDGSSGNLLSTIAVESPVLDMTMFGRGRNQSKLATITDKKLRVHKWMLE